MASANKKSSGTKLTVRSAKTLIGCVVTHDGNDHPVIDVEILVEPTPDRDTDTSSEVAEGTTRRTGHVSIGRDAVGYVITTGERNVVITTGEPKVVGAPGATTKHEAPLVVPAIVNIANELGAIRALLAGLESEHAAKMGRALDDADEEIAKVTGASKNELGIALDRALGYARSASAYTTVEKQLAPHVRAAVAWLGDPWTALLELHAIIDAENSMSADVSRVASSESAGIAAGLGDVSRDSGVVIGRDALGNVIVTGNTVPSRMPSK